MAAKKTVVRQSDTPTALTFDALQTAFTFFNDELFAGKLPACIILLHRKKNAHGYFWAERFGTKDSKTKIDEIALNPTTMRDRDDRITLSTLVHEMTHLEQQHFGKPAKGGYHNAEWAKMMDAVGLVPSTTGKAGGSRTGPKCSHYILEGGVFDVACAKLLKTGLSLPYSERRFTAPEKARAKKQRASKTKFTCPDCDAACWGKPSLNVICGECEIPMEAE